MAAAVIPIAAHRGQSPRRRFVIASVGLALVLLLLMAIQDQLFGSPFLTGYGGGAALFSWSHVATNLGIFMRQGWSVLGPLWIPGLIIGLFAARPEPRGKPRRSLRR